MFRIILFVCKWMTGKLPHSEIRVIITGLNWQVFDDIITFFPKSHLLPVPNCKCDNMRFLQNRLLRFLSEICEVIQSAGGVAVVAHPLKYGFSNNRLMKLLDAFCAVGGDGLEVISGNQNRDKTTHLARLARKFDFAASVGSDFHRPNTPWASIGRLPALPGICRPIWSDWLS